MCVIRYAHEKSLRHRRQGHLETALEGLSSSGKCELAGVCGAGVEIPAERVAETCGRKLGRTPRVFQGDYREMLDVITPDAVVICGPFEEHSSMAVEAVKRNIHVFCEKPVATTLEGLDELEGSLKSNPNVKVARCADRITSPACGARRDWRQI